MRGAPGQIWSRASTRPNPVYPIPAQLARKHRGDGARGGASACVRSPTDSPVLTSRRSCGAVLRGAPGQVCSRASTWPYVCPPFTTGHRQPPRHQHRRQVPGSFARQPDPLSREHPPMLVIDHKAIISIRRAYLRGGRERAATVLCERWRGLDRELALMTIDAVSCWRVDYHETTDSGDDCQS